MKFTSLLIAPLLAATTVLAQGIAIGAPSAGSSITPGSNFTVEVDRGDTLTGSQEVAIVIALDACGTGPCRSPYSVLGSILYSGPFDPQFSTPPNSLPPHQDFSVLVPSSFPSGPALLSVTHLSLVGAGPYPLFEVLNTTLNVA